MRCYRIQWKGIDGKFYTYLVLAESDVDAESKVQSSCKYLSQITSVEFLPFDRILN